MAGNATVIAPVVKAEKKFTSEGWRMVTEMLSFVGEGGVRDVAGRNPSSSPRALAFPGILDETSWGIPNLSEFWVGIGAWISTIE